jgi:hypothetical protein
MKGFLDEVLNPTEVQKVSRESMDKILTLWSLIEKGEQEAAVELFKIAAFAAESLTHLCEAKPEMFSPIAANQTAWPAMHSLHKGLLRKNNALMKSLKLASNTDINISEEGKAFSFDTPGVRVALDHCNLARALRRAPLAELHFDEWMTVYTICDSPTFPDRLRALEIWGQKGSGKSLPRLSRNTTLQWKMAFPEFFRLVHGEDFEQCTKLRDLRQSVFKSAKDGSNKVGDAGAVRKRMLQAVTQAVGSIAAWNAK